MRRDSWGIATAVLAACVTSGVIVAWFLHAMTYPDTTCSLGPGGHCPEPPGFLTWGLAGAAVGLVVGVLAVLALGRSLRD